MIWTQCLTSAWTAVFLIAGIPQLALASTGVFPPFTLAAGQQDDNGLPFSGAKLCLSEKPDTCYEMPPHPAPGASGLIYNFGLDPQAKQLPLKSGGSWVLFSADFFGGGSSNLGRFAILRYQEDESGRKITNLLPMVGVTNAGERAAWTIPAASAYPILVTADFIWGGEGETHYGPHFYTVEAWLFDPKADRYTKVFSYKTAKKYDKENADHVLDSERPKITRRLKAPWGY